MVRILAILLLITFIFHADHQLLAKDGPRPTYNFNPGWKLYVGDAQGAEASGFSDASWEPVSLPHAWNEDHAFIMSNFIYFT